MRLPELRAMLEDGRLERALAECFAHRDETWPSSARVEYVRFKPEVGCLLGWGSGEGSCDLGYVRILEEEAAETCYRKYAARAPEAGWVERVPGLPAVLFRYPFDRHVAGLGAVADAGKVKHILHGVVPGVAPGEIRVRGRRTEVKVFRYKPERRAVARVDAGLRDDRTGEKSSRRFVVRAFADDRGARVLAGLRALSAAGIRVTPPLGYHADRRALVCEWLEGECLADRIDRDDAGDAIERTARLLARTREVSLPANVFAAPRTAADIHREAASVLADLGDVTAGDVADAARELADALPDPHVDRAPRPSVPQHGDLHHRQVLVEEGDVSLLDWDELTLADPHEDVANFVAHLDLLVLERRLAPERAARFERRFVDASGLDAAAVAELVAPQLAKLALVPFRNLRGDWETETRAILERSLARVVRPSSVRCSR